jgi:hypothetical protein
MSGKSASAGPKRRDDKTPEAVDHAGKKRSRKEMSGAEGAPANPAPKVCVRKICLAATSMLDTLHLLDYKRFYCMFRLQTKSAPSMGLYTNKQKVLVFGSRGTTARYRHLMEDIRALIPHHKKDSKVSNALAHVVAPA